MLSLVIVSIGERAGTRTQDLLIKSQKMSVDTRQFLHKSIFTGSRSYAQILAIIRRTLDDVRGVWLLDGR